MSEQKVTTKQPGGTRRSSQAVAGVAGAVACLGIGWAVGVRSASAHATPTPVAAPITQPIVPALPAGSGEEDDGGGVQWGTLPASGLTPAQPGVGITPPSTGSGGSTVAATTSVPAPTTNAPATTTNTPAITTNPVRLTNANATAGGQR